MSEEIKENRSGNEPTYSPSALSSQGQAMEDDHLTRFREIFSQSIGLSRRSEERSDENKYFRTSLSDRVPCHKLDIAASAVTDLPAVTEDTGSDLFLDFPVQSE